MSATVDALHIRELFLQRKPSYQLSEAGRLLGMTRKQLEREARADHEDAYRANGRWRFTWRQVAYLAFRRWSLAEIHEALGPEASTVPRRSSVCVQSRCGSPSTSCGRSGCQPRANIQRSMTGCTTS